MEIKQLPKGSYINGEWLRSEYCFGVHNPYNDELLVDVDGISQQQLVNAIETSKIAFSDWQHSSRRLRTKVLLDWAETIKRDREKIARIITLEQGKPFQEALAEVDYGVSYIHWFSAETSRQYGQIIPIEDGNDHHVQHHPVGVVAVITPWNFPFAMIARKVAAALAAGCTVVVKPSELTPLTAIYVTALLSTIGLPKGVFNLVITDSPSQFGDAVTQHPDIAKISFTGSTRVGQRLNQQASRYLKRMSLELGGDAPFVVFDDADISSAVTGLLQSKLRNSGQTCISVNRILLDEKIAETFEKILLERLQPMVTGDGLNSNVDLGPLINQGAVERLNGMLALIKASGAKLIYQSSPPDSKNGFPVTVFNDVNFPLRAESVELFGPVFLMTTFSTVDDAIAKANASDHGLAAYVYGEDRVTLKRCSQELQVGMIGINQTAISNCAVPFGGIKQSGFGREGSSYGLDDYSYTKFVQTGY